jgi:hypothetical protein
MKLTGRCYCGEVNYVAEGDPVLRAQCHCRECQYIAGGAPNLFIAMPVERFSYTKGKPKQFTRSDLSAPMTREFCPNCGTHLTTLPPGWPVAVVKVGTLDDPSLFGGPDVAIHAVEKQKYHTIAEGVQAFDHLPG